MPVHRPNPKVPHSINFGVVESIFTKAEVCRPQLREMCSWLFNDTKPAPENHNQATTTVQGDRRGRFRQRPVFNASIRWPISPQRRPADIDPPENLVSGTPKRALAQGVRAIDHAHCFSRRHELAFRTAYAVLRCTASSAAPTAITIDSSVRRRNCEVHPTVVRKTRKPL